MVGEKYDGAFCLFVDFNLTCLSIRVFLGAKIIGSSSHVTACPCFPTRFRIQADIQIFTVGNKVVLHLDDNISVG